MQSDLKDSRWLGIRPLSPSLEPPSLSQGSFIWDVRAHPSPWHSRALRQRAEQRDEHLSGPRVLSSTAAPEPDPPCPLPDLSPKPPAPRCPRSAPLFKPSPLEVPPHPPHRRRDGASKEQPCHVNLPLFFFALKMGPSP